MVSLNEIIDKWHVSKLLVTNNAHRDLLAFELGQHGIYLHKFEPIQVNTKKSAMYIPHILELRSRNEVFVSGFISDHPEFQCYKIFKHGDGFVKLADCIGLAANTIKNVLNMFPKKTYYIDCGDEKIRDQFYGLAVRINQEDNIGCQFDFEHYDYRLLIKKYETMDSKFSLITILTGPGMLNAWNYGKKVQIHP